jgi:hypothetical protein
VNRPHLLVPGLALTLVACSSGNKQGEGVDAAGADAAVIADAGPDAPVVDLSRVYCHSGKELLRLDTRTNVTVDIGPFGAALGTASMTDIAVDKNDKMIGVSLNKIWQVDTATGTATLLAPFAAGTPNVTSLSFVPKNLDDPNSDEILVAADDHGNVFQIDPATGATTKVGNYGMNGTDQIISSGDIVAVRGAGIFATVDVGPTLSNPDYLARIDPTTWAATLVGTGNLGHDKLFGLGYWGGSLYGFADAGATAGAIIAIDPKTAAVTPVVSGTTPWFGAGVTTDAPIVVN